MESFLAGFRRFREFVRGRARRTEFRTFVTTQAVVTGLLLAISYVWVDTLLTESRAIDDATRITTKMLLTVSV